MPTQALACDNPPPAKEAERISGQLAGMRKHYERLSHEFTEDELRSGDRDPHGTRAAGELTDDMPEHEVGHSEDEKQAEFEAAREECRAEPSDWRAWTRYGEALCSFEVSYEINVGMAFCCFERAWWPHLSLLPHGFIL